MSTVFKGLTRPALIRGLGVPLYPFLGMCVICVLLGVWIHEAMYALILPGWYAIKRVTKIDERFFDLLYLRMQIKGNSRQAFADIAREAFANSVNIPPTLYKNQGEIITLIVGQDLDFSSIYKLKMVGTRR